MCARHLPRLRSAQPHYGHNMQREGDSRGAKRKGRRAQARRDRRRNTVPAGSESAEA